jgi:hypothetical protein
MPRAIATPPPESLLSSTRDTPAPPEEGAELVRAIETNVTRLEPAQERVRDARRGQVRARVPEHDPAARSEHARHLVHGSTRVRIVVEGVRTEQRSERVVVEGQPLGVGDLERHVVEILGQVTRVLDHLRGQIDADDRCSEGRRGPGRRPGAAPDVEEAIVESEVQRLEGGTLDGISPPRRHPGLVATGAPIEPPASVRLLVAHLARVYGRGSCDRTSWYVVCLVRPARGRGRRRRSRPTM